MAKIKLNENELRSLISEAITNVKKESSQPIRIKISELRQVVKHALLEGNGSTFKVEADFEVERDSVDPATEDYSPLVFKIMGVMRYGNMGIGRYDYQGSQETNDDIRNDLESCYLVDGSYNPADAKAIDEWLSKNMDEVKQKLYAAAE